MGNFLDNNTEPDMPSTSILVETLVLLVLTLILSFVPSFSATAPFVPLAYLLVERRVRGRSWAEFGFDRTGLPRALARTWPLVLWVGLVNQIVPIWVGKVYWPGLLEHIASRVPTFGGVQSSVLLLVIVVATLGEELVFRALFSAKALVVHGSTMGNPGCLRRVWSYALDRGRSGCCCSRRGSCHSRCTLLRDDLCQEPKHLCCVGSALAG